jgi:hypothetical protein
MWKFNTDITNLGSLKLKFVFKCGEILSLGTLNESSLYLYSMLIGHDFFKNPLQLSMIILTIQSILHNHCR